MKLLVKVMRVWKFRFIDANFREDEHFFLHSYAKHCCFRLFVEGEDDDDAEEFEEDDESEENGGKWNLFRFIWRIGKKNSRNLPRNSMNEIKRLITICFSFKWS